MRYLLHGFHQLLLIFWIYIGCGFIQNNNRRIFQHRPGNGKSLAFSTRERTPASPITVSYPCGSFMIKSWQRAFSCLYNLFHGCIRLSKSDIIGYRIMKQIYILEHKAEIFHQAVHTVLPHIMTAQCDLPGIHIPET